MWVIFVAGLDSKRVEWWRDGELLCGLFNW